MNRKARRAAGQGSGHAAAGAAGALTPGKEAERLAELGLEHHQAGRLVEARDAYRRALRADAGNLDAQMNLGVVLAQSGCQRSAPVELRRALQMAPRSALLQRNAGLMFFELGLWDDAVVAFETAATIDPRDPIPVASLAHLLRENGDAEKAAQLARRAIALAPTYAHAHFVLHSALYDDRDLRPAAKAMSQAVALEPGNAWYRLCLGILLDQVGDAKDARTHLDRANADGVTHAGALDSWAYVKSQTRPGTRFLPTTRETLRFALDCARPDGLVLEFGVRFGISTRWIAERVKGPVHGFDSFQGLPETWHIQPTGTYSTHGETPELPANVELHVGLFDKTLPPFREKHDGPVRFINVDCDLYSSTKTIFDQLGDRIGAGTVIAFDEYILNDAWRQDEFKAFQEAVVARGWRYEYLAFGIESCQAVVRITG
jgi:Flp pilus assembly protein TadD